MKFCRGEVGSQFPEMYLAHRKVNTSPCPQAASALTHKHAPFLPVTVFLLMGRAGHLHPDEMKQRRSKWAFLGTKCLPMRPALYSLQIFGRDRQADDLVPVLFNSHCWNWNSEPPSC
jgi:hypothetical protein